MTKEEAIKILEYPVKKWSMEWDEREDGLSYYEALDMAISALRQQDVADKDVGKNEPLTNAQKIRAMSDEEIAEYVCRNSINTLCDIICGGECNAISTLKRSGDWACKEIVMKWLQQPAEEDKHENLD